MATHIHELLARDITAISFSTDIWSSDVSPVINQGSITDVAAICRKIVGHFKHSPLAYSCLQAVQIQLGMKPKRLQQDDSTRWYSTFYMMESLLEQKCTLATYAADYDLPATLSVHQWQSIENFTTLLSPFEQLTREVSSSESSAAEVIPSVTALRCLLSKQADTDHGVKTAKTALLEAVNKCFDQIDYDSMFCIATFLDPRYKDRYFDEDVKQPVACCHCRGWDTRWRERRSPTAQEATT